MTRSWRLEISEVGRPLLNNAVHRMNPHVAKKRRQEWADAAFWHAKAQGIPHLSHVDVKVQARYKTRSSPSDTDAPAPAVKGVLDGLKTAGVLTDDSAMFVRSVTYISCRSGTGLPDCLVVWVVAS